MKQHTRQYLPTLLMALLSPMVATAHSGCGLLGSSISATDYHQITCFDNGNGVPDHLYFQVKGQGTVSAPVVSAEVSKGLIAMNVTDSSSADALYSQSIQVNGGVGTYHVTIDKSKLGLAKYSFQYHCQTQNNVHTGTTIVTIESKKRVSCSS